MLIFLSHCGMKLFCVFVLIAGGIVGETSTGTYVAFPSFNSKEKGFIESWKKNENTLVIVD